MKKYKHTFKSSIISSNNFKIDISQIGNGPNLDFGVGKKVSSDNLHDHSFLDVKCRPILIDLSTDWNQAGSSKSPSSRFGTTPSKPWWSTSLLGLIHLI